MELSYKKLKKINNNPALLQLLIDEQIWDDETDFKNDYHYQKELEHLQKELIGLQNYIETSNKRVLIIFEGRDTAGKGGAIKTILQKLDTKIFSTTALSAPTDVEKAQWYFQRYLHHLPNAGQVKLFDRSWYNRAVVEPVFGFCTTDQYNLFMKQVLDVEKMLVDDGIILIKLFLKISKEEQEKRLNDRKEKIVKQWKMGRLDAQAIEKWDTYTTYIEKLLPETSQPLAPWIEVKTDSKKKARIQVIKNILNAIPYKDGEKEDIDPTITKTYT